MLVSYFIPEDGDSKEHPNVFSCEASSLTLSELRKVFPVPGKYHFRALRAVGDMNVWLDLVDDDGAVPPYRGEVVLKVSRISLGGAASRQSSAALSPSASQPTQQNQQSSSHSPRARDEAQGQTQSMDATQDKSPRMTVPERRGSEKLLSFDTFDDSNNTPPASTASPFDGNSGDVFDFSTQDTQQQQQQQQPPHHQRNNSNNTMNDFMNFPTSSATPPPMMNNSMQGGGMGGMSGGMHRGGGGSSGNINGMNHMNANNMRQQQQQKQQQNRNAMGGLDPFGSF